MSPQCAVLLDALRRGERLTMLTALNRYQIGAVSQRAGELRRLGYPVTARMIRVPTGKRVAEYAMQGVSEWTT